MNLEPLQQKIDYSKLVTGKSLDYANYEHKFKQWDYVLEHDLFINKDVRAMQLLNDVTIYTYAFFKDIRTGKPFRMAAYQDAIAACKHDFTHDNPNRYIAFQASNQIGKSELLILKSIWIMFNETNRTIVIVSKNLPQSQFLLKRFRQLLNNSLFAHSWHEDIGETDNTTILTFERDNGKSINRVICTPSGEGTLGYPVDYLFLDEVDFYEDSKEFFWKVAFPRTKQTKGQIIVFSNPNTTIPRNNSILYELMNSSLFLRKFKFNFLDAPWNTRAEYERDKRNSPSHLFISTHDGEFSDEFGSFFSHREVQDMLQHDWDNTLPYVDTPVYIGLDIGKMYDRTVLAIGIVKKPVNALDKYYDLDVKYVKEFPVKTDYDVIVNELMEIKQYYDKNCRGVARIGYDATGQKTFGDLCKRMGISVIPVDFARKETNKTLLYNDFKLMAENRKIKVVYSQQAEKQLSELMFKMTENKKYRKIEASSESVHDDVCDAIAILINVSVTPSRIPVSITFVDDKQQSESQHVNRPEPADYVQEYLKKTIKQHSPKQYGNEFDELRNFGIGGGF